MKENNYFESAETAEQWVEMLDKDHGDIENSGRVRVIYPYILQWISNNNIQKLLDIGCGEGYLGSIVPDYIKYVGVEPSENLLTVAEKRYAKNNVKYVQGNAYNMPSEIVGFEGAVSVMVWFHLKDLDKSAQQLSKVLEKGGKFLIITSNSQVIETWKSFYNDLDVVDGYILIGRFNTLQSQMQKSEIYVHDNNEIKKSLEESGLVVDKIQPLGLEIEDKDKIFVAISGHKE